MGWNRSKENGEAVSRPLQKRKGFRFSVKGAVVGAIVVLGAGVAAWWLSPSGETRQDAASTKRSCIKEVAPAAIVRRATPTNGNIRTETTVRKRERKFMYPRLPITPGMTTNGVTELDIEHRTFKEVADIDIAGLATIEPGEPLVGDVSYNRHFTKEFLKAIKTPISIAPEDSDEVKELKQTVIEVRKELKERYDAGEDIAQIMTDTRKELQNLGFYKQDLERCLGELTADGNLTEQEINQYIEAANSMLRERGGSSIQIPGYIRHQLRLKNKERNGK